MPNKVQFKLTKLQTETSHRFPTPISSSQAELFSPGRGRESDLRGSLRFFHYFIKIRQSSSLARPRRYLPPRALPGQSQRFKLADGKDRSHQYGQDGVHPGSGQWKGR